MKQFVIFFLLISSSLVAQELKLVKATSRTVNQIASVTSTTHYCVLIKKEKSFKLSVDSVIDIYTQKPAQYYITKANNADQPLKSFSKRYKGLFQIIFSTVKIYEPEQPKTPMSLKVPVSGFTQGIVIYYRTGKKKKQLTVESFDVLEALNVP